MNEKEQGKLLFNYFLYFVCFIFVCFVGVSRIFAAEHNMGSWSNYTEVLLEIPGAGAPIGLNKDTYNVAGNFTQVYINIGNISINKDYIYQLEISTPGSKFTNVNYVLVNQIVGGNGVNQSCNMIGFTDANIGYPKIYFQCPTSFSNGTMTFTLYNINGADLVSEPQYFKWGYTNFRYYDNIDEIDWGPVTSNATQNAQNIINNNNQNTQNIINNQNQNTQDIINSNKVCEVYDKDSIVLDNKYISNSSGVIGNSDATGVSNYIFIQNAEVKFLSSVPSSYQMYFCYYDDSKNPISCSRQYSENVILTPPSSAKYIRITIQKSSNKPSLQVCKNGNQGLNDSINGLNDNLNNDDTTGATSEASDFFSSFSTNTFGLTSIITAPLNLINSVLSSSCSNLELPLPYLDNKKLILPCMTSIYSQYFGTFFTIYQTITYGIIAYWVCVRIFNQVKDFKNPEHDEIEVMDL